MKINYPALIAAIFGATIVLIASIVVGVIKLIAWWNIANGACPPLN